MAKQELGEPMAGPQDVFAEVLARADQVADGFFLGWRDADAGELAGPEQAGEHARITSVGLYPLSRAPKG